MYRGTPQKVKRQQVPWECAELATCAVTYKTPHWKLAMFPQSYLLYMEAKLGVELVVVCQRPSSPAKETRWVHTPN